jgi:RimJ/RimL family protein N-acetyltransferase
MNPQHPDDGWPLHYKAWPVARRQIADLTLRPVHRDDAETIRLWRNAQMAILRQRSAITADQQQVYFETQVRPDFLTDQPDKILLAVLQDNRMIGYGGLVHFDWEARKAEVSFLCETSRAGTPDDHAMVFPDFLEMLKPIAFNDLGLNRIWTETYDTRVGYVAAMRDAGFQHEGRLRDTAFLNGALTGSTLQGLLANDPAPTT